MDKEVKNFCHKYDAYVTESHRMHRRVKRMAPQMWSESDPELFQTIPYEDVKCVEVHMPEDRFRALVEHDHWLEVEQRRGGAGGYFGEIATNIVRNYEEETRLQHQHPGVMDAWQQYQTMLQLVK